MHVLELWSCQFIDVRLPIETDQEYSIKFTIIATSHMIHFCRLGTFWFSSTYYHELTQLWLLSSGVEVDENRHVVAGSHDCSAHFAILILTAALLHHSTCQKSNPEFFVHRNERKYMLYFSASVVCPKAAYLLAYCLKKKWNWVPRVVYQPTWLWASQTYTVHIYYAVVSEIQKDRTPPSWIWTLDRWKN